MGPIDRPRTVRRSRRRRRGASPAVLLLGLLVGLGAGAPSVGHAEVKVAGSTAAARIVVNHEPIAKVLDAVAGALKLHYRASFVLDEAVSGTYSGTLSEVMSSLLGGYNYIIRHDDEAVEIVVLGRRGERPVAGPSRPAAPAKSIAAQWR